MSCCLRVFDDDDRCVCVCVCVCELRSRTEEVTLVPGVTVLTLKLSEQIARLILIVKTLNV